MNHQNYELYNFAPTRADIRTKLHDLLNKTLTPEDVSDWASPWIAADDPCIEDDAVWQALGHLAGADLRHSQNGPYLHNEISFNRWIQEFEDACASNPIKE